MNTAAEYVYSQLDKNNATVEKIDHPPVTTCEEADFYTPIPEAGLKNLLLKTKSGDFVLCVLLGTDNIDFKRVKEIVGKKVKMVDFSEAVEILNCDPGSVPPIISIDATILVDTKVMKYDVLYFNPGVNTVTLGVEREVLVSILQTKHAIFDSIRIN